MGEEPVAVLIRWHEPTANADDSPSTTSGPNPDSPEGNWIETTAGKSWFLVLRLYSPVAPFCDKSWQPSEIEPLAKTEQPTKGAPWLHRVMTHPCSTCSHA